MVSAAVVNPWNLGLPTIIPPIHFQYDFWQHLHLPVALGFRPVSFPPGWVTSSPATTLQDILLCAGLATSPATTPGLIGAWGFLIEYADYFGHEAGPLRVADAAASWDSRTKGLFAERLGMGLAAWLLWRRLGVVHIADAGPFIEHAAHAPDSAFNGAGLQSCGTHGLAGGYKPDFFCLTGALDVVIAESKGALGPPSAISSERRQKAKQQTENVEPVGVPLREDLGRLAFCANIRRVGENPKTNCDTGVRVEDPVRTREPLPVPLSADEIVLAAYAKFLRLCWLEGATCPPRTEKWPLMDMAEAGRSAKTVRGASFLFFARIGGMVLGLSLEVAQALFAHETAGVAQRVAEALALLSKKIGDLGLEGEDGTTVLPNGIIGVSVHAWERLFLSPA